MPVTVTLPYPPQANHMHTVARGRKISSSSYRAWRDECGLRLMAQRAPMTAGPFSIDLQITRPDRRRRDIDNLIKPCLDAIKSAGLIEDDSLASKVSAEWRPIGSAPGVTATITAVAA